MLRFAICTYYLEWKAAKKFRNRYFFTPQNIKDPYLWTFDHEDHKHFVLYKEEEIIGYAHIQLWPENRAAIRIIAIDKTKHRQGYGSYFIQLIEKWLKSLGFKTIHAESSPKALKFYEKLGFTGMLFDDPSGDKSSPDDIAVGKAL